MMELVEELARWSQGERLHKSQVRWHAEAIPLRVYLPPRDDDMAGKLLTSVLRDWEAASLGQVRFTRAVTAEGVDIALNWADEPVPGRDFEVGHTRRTLQGNNRIARVEITLLESPAIDRRLSPGRQAMRLRATLLHELGHALGLEHSGNPLDVMHHRGWQNAFLSDNDCRAIQALYQQADRLSLG